MENNQNSKREAIVKYFQDAYRIISLNKLKFQQWKSYYDTLASIMEKTVPGENHPFVDAVKGSYVSEVNFAAFANGLISAEVMLFTEEQAQEYKKCVNELKVFVELVNSFNNKTNKMEEMATLRKR